MQQAFVPVLYDIAVGTFAKLHAIVEAQAERRFRQNFQQRSIVGWEQVLNDR